MARETNNDRVKRLEFLDQEQSALNSMLAENELLANRLASVLVERQPTSSMPSTVAEAITALEEQLQDATAEQKKILTQSVTTLTKLGVGHSVSDAVEELNSMEPTQYMGIGDELALEYITRVIEGKPNTNFYDQLVKATKERERALTEEEAAKLLGSTGEQLGIQNTAVNYLTGNKEVARELEKAGFKLTDKQREQLAAEVVARPDIDEVVKKMVEFEYEEVLARLGEKDLLSRVYDDKVKGKIYGLVTDSVQKGESPFQLAQKIQRFVKDDIPRSNINTIANTELVRAYNHGKRDVNRRIHEDFPEMAPYVDVSLSPFHPRPDICDLLVGTYELEEAPIPPHHPNCICKAKHYFRPRKKSVGTTTMKKNIREGPKTIKGVKIHVPDIIDGKST
jgi:uncharacterized membrane-anchored protein YjiN (DUF445 family)